MLAIVEFEEIGQVVCLRSSNDVKQQVGVGIWNDQSFIVVDFTLQHLSVVLMPVHESLANLLFLVDLRQNDLAVEPLLALLIVLDLFLTLQIAPQMQWQFLLAGCTIICNLSNRSCLPDILIKVLFFEEVSTQFVIIWHIFEVVLKLLFGLIVKIVVQVALFDHVDVQRSSSHS